jgi:hypothetical protein
MEYGAYWMTVLVVLLLLAMGAERAIEIYNDVRRYVHRWQSAQIEPRIARYVENREKTNEYNSGTEYRDIPDTYQPEPASTNAASTGISLANTADLVRHLSGLRKANGDYAMSGNRIVAAVEMGRNEVLAIVREVRGNPPEPAEPYNPTKHLLLDGVKRWIPR